MFKVIVAGPRDFTDSTIIFSALDYYLQNIPADQLEIVSGGATGVDSLGEAWAKNHTVKCTVFPADWQTHGKAAGPIRNKQMAEYADALIAFVPKAGVTKGTANMISQADTCELRLRIVTV